MSIYRSFLTVLVAVAIASPVFADDTTNTSTSTTTTTAQTETQSTQININSASVRELMKVKGINATKARAIVAYRKRHGNFKTLDTLIKVKGFTKIKADELKNIQDQLTV